jgi:hypothetical protein
VVKSRIVETDEGIQGEFNVETYDRFMRRMRDKGWIETDLVLKTGIEQGLALEVGPRPGYLGLELLRIWRWSSRSSSPVRGTFESKR